MFGPLSLGVQDTASLGRERGHVPKVISASTPTMTSKRVSTLKAKVRATNVGAVIRLRVQTHKARTHQRKGYLANSSIQRMVAKLEGTVNSTTPVRIGRNLPSRTKGAEVLVLHRVLIRKIDEQLRHLSGRTGIRLHRSGLRWHAYLSNVL